MNNDDFIRDILHINPKYMLHEDYGKYGYESQYLIGENKLRQIANDYKEDCAT